MLRTITTLHVVLMGVAGPSVRKLSGLLTLLSVLALAAGPAEAVCSRTWVGGVDSNFGTAGNWSPGTVPGSGDDACITATTTTIPPAVANSYTVILNGNFSVHSLTLGGPNGTQTLVLPSANLSFGLGADSAVTQNGVLTLGDSGGGFSVLAGPGALTNSGHLNAIVGGGNVRYLRTNISNGGSIAITADTNQDQGTLTTNNGTVTIGVGGSLSLSSGSSFANNAGAVSNNGAFSVSGGTFIQRAGTGMGNAVTLLSSTLDDDTSAAAAQFNLAGGTNILTGSGNNPGVAAGQILTIAASNTETDVPKDLVNAGTVTLGDAGGGYSILAGPGLLTNTGHLNTIAGGGNARYLRLNITNGSNGTIDIAGPDTRQDASQVGPTTFTNIGTVTVEAAGVLSLSGGSSFANNGGTVTNNGGFSLSSGTFTQRGGTESGHPVLLSGSTLDDDLGAGAALFGFTGNGTLTGTGTTPGIATGQVITIAANNIEAALAKDLTNAGTITLGDAGGGYSILRGPGLLTNSGQLNTIAGGGNIRYLRLNITNDPAGTVDIAGPDTRQDASQVGATTFVNNGTVTVEAAGGLSLSGGSSFTNTGGAVINNGAFSMSGGTFTQRGGTESSHAVLLSGSTLDDDVGAGAGFFTFTGNGTLTGTGSTPGVAASQAVNVSNANIFVALGVSLTNAGTITLGDGNGGFSGLAGPGALTNSGQLNTVQGGGNTRYFRLNIGNAAGGTIDIGASDTRQDSGTLTTNNGTVIVEAAGNLSLSSGSSFANNGGAVTNNGGFSMSGGTFTQRGGTESIHAVLLSGSTLDDDVGAGAGLFNFTSNGTLTGTGSKPGVAAAQVVTLSAANIMVALPVNLTNAGTITLGDGGGGYSVLQGPGALTNSGQLNTVQGGGNARYFRLNISNAASGTIDIGAIDTRQDSETLTTNNGTVMIEAARSLSLSSGSSFSQGASATFATTLDANTTTFGQLTGGGGPVGLDGKLRVTTVGSPVIGSSWPIISSANRSGQFAALDFGSNNYDVQYPSTGVTLVTLSPLLMSPTPTKTPTPTATPTTATTPTSTVTPTVTKTNTGAPTATSTATVPQTRTATPTASVAPSATATQTPTATGTQASSATATASTTSTDTPTATPTPSPTSTPTLSAGMVVLAGRVLSPGRGGLVTDHGQVAFGGAAVDLFLCEVRKPCLATGQPVASSVTDPDGRFRIQVSAELIQGTLPVVVARIAPTLALRAPVLVLPVSQAAAAAHARQVANDTETVVDSISEAAMRLLENVGFENFSVAGVGSVVQAVKSANATANFEDLTAEQAVAQAQGTAASDPAVQLALTPTPGCVGDCDGSGDVTVDELIKGVNIALGSLPLTACSSFDTDHSGEVTINELITAVNNALAGCPVS